MSESPSRHSPLHRVLEPAVHGLSERAFQGQLILRGNPADPAFANAVGEITGLALPLVPNSRNGDGAAQIAWLGPREWQLTVPAGEEAALLERLRAALAGLHAAVIDVTDGYTVLVVDRVDAAEILARDCPLDLHPRVFQVGSCVQSLVGKSNALIVREDAQRFAILVRRSFATYLWALLKHSTDLVERARA